MKRHQDKIKEALIQDLPVWDEEMVWEEIEKTLPVKRKRRFVIWILPAFVIGVVFCRLMINHTTYEGQQTTALKGSSFEVNSSTGSTSDLELQRNFNERFNAALERDDVKTDTKNTDEIYSRPEKVNASLANSIERNISAENSNKLKESNPLYTSQSFSLLSPQKSNSSSDIIESLNTEASNSTHPISTGFTGSGFMKSTENEDTFPSLSLLDTRTSVLFAVSHRLPMNLYVPYVVQPQVEPTSGSKSWSLGLWSGIYLSNRKTSSTESAYADQLKALETSELGLAVRRGFVKRWSFGVGLVGRQTVESFTANDTLKSQRLVESDSATVVVINNVDTYFEGETTETTLIPRSIISPNRLKQLLIPFNLNYDLPLKKLHLSFGVGMEFKVISRYKGYLLDSKGKWSSDESLISSRYNYRPSLNAIAWSAQLAYPLAKHFDLNLGMNYSYGLGDHFASPEHKLKYDLLGLRLGVSTRL